MKYVIANWKMKMDLASVEEWMEGFEGLFKLSPNVVAVIAPSFPHIHKVKELLFDPSIKIASQDVSANIKGSHTGEVGAFQLKDYCTHCIIGHSERAEDPALVAAKRDIALSHGLVPILCFTSPQQAKFFYKSGVILAWEDPQNISKDGKYREKPLEEIEESMEEIRKLLPEGAVLLYGGSVNKDNIGALSGIDGLDGVLVGQASLDPHHFWELIKAYEISRS